MADFNSLEDDMKRDIEAIVANPNNCENIDGRVPTISTEKKSRTGSIDNLDLSAKHLAYTKVAEASAVDTESKLVDHIMKLTKNIEELKQQEK